MLTQRGQGLDCRAEVIRSDIDRRRRNGMLRFPERNEAVQGVMHAHGRNERPGEIGAHLPIKANGPAGSGSADETSESGFAELNRPAGISGLAGRKASLANRIEPLGNKMEVLTVRISL